VDEIERCPRLCGLALSCVAGKTGGDELLLGAALGQNGVVALELELVCLLAESPSIW